MSVRRLGAALAVAALIAGATSTEARAQDHSRIFTETELAADADRLKKVVTTLWDIAGTVLTTEEKAALDGLAIEFPMPTDGDKALEFYAFSDFGERVVVMPLMSLKMLEDVTTAYAYLLDQGLSPGTIDLYFAMIERPEAAAFAARDVPPMLPTLGVPAEAWQMPRVDELSLRLRNEAFAFAFFHELGHVVKKHRGLDEITPAQALADETEADQFALDLFGRTETPALGAALLFQAQAYGQPNRGGFESEAAWTEYLTTLRTHPVTTERIRAFSGYVERDLAERREAERALWTFIGGGLEEVARILDDVPIQTCIARIADVAPIEALGPSAQDPLARYIDLCR